ncbi:Neurotransmitter-gated ion-channel transmembrane region [Trichostrongylus colubriformis]|uniref:Neurotransmitter-gated ion-channel transmembrane region n=1 Tax=Trichostrongylus colubriformis TaxID=6319 RepID=A0AAN8FPZ7_TRICO
MLYTAEEPTTEASTNRLVSLGVTALLSLAIILMMVSDKLPATSDTVPLLGGKSETFLNHRFPGQPISRRVRGLLLSIKVNKSSVLQWFFGKELMNAQESIRMRLRKYDKLSDLKRSFARSFLNLQTTLLKTDEPRHHKLPLMNGNDGEEAVCRVGDPMLYNIVIDLLAGVQAIRQEMMIQEHVKRIRREWQMLARMMDKMIMWIFVVCTILFASFMLYDRQDPPVITDEMMREKSSA